MAEGTGISWCECTHNQWLGCQETGSPACIGCYAREMMAVRFRRVEWGPHGTRISTSDGNHAKPLGWNRHPEKLKMLPPPGTKPFVFGGSLMDFADNKAPPGEQLKLFNLIRATPNLQWLMLTKRISNVVKLAKACGGWPENAALMITAVTQEEADRDTPKLLIANELLKPTFIGLSMEPLYERVDITPWVDHLNWVIVGGGTDQGVHKAYETDVDWLRDIRDQCRAARSLVAFHMKQMTREAPIPPDLQIQERPLVPVREFA